VVILGRREKDGYQEVGKRERELLLIGVEFPCCKMQKF
jgi:hypothetical protein